MWARHRARDVIIINVARDGENRKSPLAYLRAHPHRGMARRNAEHFAAPCLRWPAKAVECEMVSA